MKYSANFKFKVTQDYLDNSLIESFFNLLKRECLNRLVITSIDQLKKVVRDYIQ
ncbi:IS3 family transposase [Limosilactobacillus fastidiosus]|uniref:IS3 family transposase n=1 Tax=Limosilactobacillus fastidiosus TaxID=2759855 RepID=A0A7W3YBP1_9LACO|nr:IS3 family transposase [Limosilactobacillus fastidiosus]MBB1085246.1 IS3 family transposase [Limosilactobacillus fastidiosus]